MWLEVSKYDLGLLLWQTWINWFQYRFMDGLVQWLRIDEKLVAKTISSAPQLEFVKGFSPREGDVPWLQKGERRKRANRKSAVLGLGKSGWASVSATIVIAAILIMYKG